MPTAKKYTPKRKYVPKRKYTPKRQPNLDARVRSIVKGMSETKQSVTSLTESTTMGTTLTSPATIAGHSLNVLNQGVADHNRIGNSVSGMMINLRGSIHCTGGTAIYHKLMVIEANSQSDPLLDLLEDNAGNFAPATADLQAIYARVNTHKYKILATRTYKTGTVSNTANDSNADRLFNITFKTPGTYEYDEGSTQVQKRRIIFLRISRRGDNDDALGTAVEMSWNSKFYFKDL